MVFNAFIVTLVINVTKPAPIEKRSSEPRRNVNSLGRTPPSRLRCLYLCLCLCLYLCLCLSLYLFVSMFVSTSAFVFVFVSSYLREIWCKSCLGWRVGVTCLSITQNSSFTRHLRVNYTLITYLHHYASLIVNYTSNTRFHILHAN